MVHKKSRLDRSHAIVNKLWASKSPIGLNESEWAVLVSLSDAYTKFGKLDDVGFDIKDKSELKNFQRLIDKKILYYDPAQGQHSGWLMLTDLEKQELQNVVENEGMAKGGKILLNYQAELEAMDDEELKEEYENEFGVDAENRIEDEREDVISELVSHFKTVLKSRGEMAKGGEAGDSVDTLNMDVPLFIRMLEYAKEDAKTDMDLHKVTENAIAKSKNSDVLTMNNYDSIVSGSGVMAKGGESGGETFDKIYAEYEKGRLPASPAKDFYNWLKENYENKTKNWDEEWEKYGKSYNSDRMSAWHFYNWAKPRRDVHWDIIKLAKGGKAGEKMVTIYHFFGSYLQDGQLFPPFAIENNKWTTDRSVAEKIFNEAGLHSFTAEGLEEAKPLYRDGVLLFELQSAKVSESDWKHSKSLAKTGGYLDANDFLNEASGHDWDTIKERAIFIDGDKVSKKELSEYWEGYGKGGNISGSLMKKGEVVTILEDSPVNINFSKGTFSESGLSKEQITFLKRIEKLWLEDKLTHKTKLAELEKYKNSGKGEEILDALQYWESLNKPLDKQSAFHPSYLSDYLAGGGKYYLQISVGGESNSRKVNIAPKLESLLKEVGLLYPVTPKNYYFKITKSGDLYIEYQSIIGSRMIASNVIVDYRKGGDTSPKVRSDINWLITG